IEKVETAWEKKDIIKVITLIHSLKGSASGIGATELYALSKDFEKKLRQKTELPVKGKTDMASLESALVIVLSSIKAIVLKSSSGKRIKKPVTMDFNKSKTILTKMEEALVFPEFSELEYLVSQLEPVCNHRAMPDLMEQIASYDYGLAKETVKIMKSKQKEQAYETP
ncbi:MAG: Hpt domain-containing protein, partial [Desulfobacteraceae bacterium]|nr:Hpt domain-containing protein [Desulfobacteraceae bacterium]